jgi:Transposase DDE domain
MAGWRHRLRIGTQSRLARQRTEDRSLHPGDRQVEARRRTFSREDFVYDEVRDVYTCPAGKTLTTTGYICTDHAIRYLASVPECRVCQLKAKCCPNMPARRVVRDVNEAARDVARDLAKTQAFARSRHDRKKIEMLFAHLKRILRLDRLRLRGPAGAQFEFTLAAIAQNLRRLAKLVARPTPLTSTMCVA